MSDILQNHKRKIYWRKLRRRRGRATQKRLENFFGFSGTATNAVAVTGQAAVYWGIILRSSAPREVSLDFIFNMASAQRNIDVSEEPSVSTARRSKQRYGRLSVRRTCSGQLT